jgi:hypothetical protein
MPWLHANTIQMAYHIMQYLPIHVHITFCPLSSITFNSDWTIEIVSFRTISDSLIGFGKKLWNN